MNNAPLKNIAALRPCFERYANHRLVNLQPYHSEWRMKSEERCLQFCSDTSILHLFNNDTFQSRCRSIVYDAVQHICHFFLDDGYDFTVPAAKMIYLKVVSGTCLETYASSSSKTSEVINFGENPKESTSVESVSAIPTKQKEMVISLLLKTSPKRQRIIQAQVKEHLQDSQLARPDRREAISDIDQEKKFGEQRWDSSRKQVMETTSSSNFEDEQLHEKKNDKRTKETALSSEKKESLERKLHEKLELFKEMYPDRYVQYLLERGYAPLPFLASEIRATTPLVFGTVSPQMSKRMLVRVEPPYLTKARSFLNIVNSKKNSTTGDKGMDYQRPLDDYAVVSSDTGCLVGHVPIWLVFENSIGSESIDSSFAKDWKACREMCSDEVSVPIPFYSK
uniref:Apple domain-containing protein n=1 Tax=Angiostrongylus cantonensis TaxID=6313 RepID=A0A0K0D008_ANGCA